MMTGGVEQVAVPPRQIRNDGFYLTAVLFLSITIPSINGGLIASLKKTPALFQTAAL